MDLQSNMLYNHIIINHNILNFRQYSKDLSFIFTKNSLFIIVIVVIYGILSFSKGIKIIKLKC
jgi:hypothetical protein